MAKQRQASRRPALSPRRKLRELSHQRMLSRKLHLESLEERRVMAAGLNLVAVLNNSVTLLNSGDTLNVAPRELSLRFAQGQSIDASSINSSSVKISRAGGDGVFDASGPPVVVSPVADVPITPGFLAISPDSSREIVMRFAANLPDDLYKVEIVGALKDSLGNSATPATVTFNLELGTKVSAVVPQPITRNNATKAISQSRNTIEVYFDSNELNAADRLNPGFYRLIDTATGRISIPNATTPVSYDTTRKMATLRFATDIPGGTYKLEVGVTAEADGTTVLARHVGNSMVDVIGNPTTIQAFIGDSLTLTAANQGNDVDLYRFDLVSDVTDFGLTVSPSATLDAAVRLFQLNANGSVTEVGSPINADGAGFTETATALSLTAGTYFVGVSAGGNTNYNAQTGAGNTGGTSTGSYSINVTFSDAPGVNDANSSFATATLLGTLGLGGRNISASILSQAFDIQFPGAGDAPGERNTPFESHLTTITGRLPDPTGGVETFTYDFQQIYGFSPTGQQLSNAITEPQKQRVREALELYSRYLGVQFREVSSTSTGVQADITIATGEPRAVAPTISTGIANPGAIDGVNGIAGIHNIPFNGTVTNTSGVTNLLATNNAANITAASGFFVSPTTGLISTGRIRITSVGHGLTTGAKIHIAGVKGNTAANGTWVVRVVDADSFDLDGSIGNGAYIPGAAGAASGTWNLLDLSQTVAIMNSLVSWGSSEFGGAYFETAMHEIGHLLGLGDNFEAVSRTIMGRGETPSLASNFGEAVYPGDADIVYGQTTHRPESRDIDLYQFAVTEPGLFRAETIAERLQTTSLLNTVLTLYQETLSTTTGTITAIANDTPLVITSLNHHLATGDRVRISGVGGTTSANGDFTVTVIDANTFTLDGSAASGPYTSGGTWTKFARTIVARNDDYYGNDSYLELHLGTGRYFIAVTSVGNTEFDPSITDSGFGGRTQGNYNLSMNLRPDAVTSMMDTGGVRFDGDADGAPGGQYEFWFQSNTATNTIYVDKLNTQVNQTGLIANPYNNLATALSVVNALPNGAEKILRIVGNGGTDNNLNTLGDNSEYKIGYRNVALTQPLTDGGDFNVPANVTVMIDAGANFKLRRANLNAGTTPQGLNSRAGGAIQVLGTPIAGESVVFTSYADDSVGGDDDGPSAGPQGGDYGGIVFRDDSDREAAGVFLNYVNYANLKFGGGKVTVDSVEGQFTPIFLDNARPTIANNTITTSAAGAMSASPNSFDDDGMDLLGKYKNMPFDQRRIGPDVHDNTLTGNSINGMFIRIRTLAGNPLDLVDLSTRWDDTDIVHVVSENLAIAGTPGGSMSPGSDRPATIQSDGRLRIDAGMVVKLSSARIETKIGSQFIAEGNNAQPIIFTSLKDDRYGGSGTFDTNRDGSASVAIPGDWGGLVFGPASTASIAQSRITFGGGIVPIEGGFDRFNAIEIQQADVRIANSLLQFNDSGAATGTRNGRGSNVAATIFVRGAQPIIVANTIRDNSGPMISINANALQDIALNDSGQATGALNLLAQSGANRGPLIRNNRATNNAVNGMEVRGATLTTETVWDDTDIAHILHNEIIIPNHQVNSGLRLQSSATESLVVKLSGPTAGFTASGRLLDIDDRIGGTVHLIGQPGHPVILTSISDDTVPAGFDPNGSPIFDTDNSLGTPLIGPEINNATLIDNDILAGSVGHFELRPAAGGSVGLQVPGTQSGVTAQGQSLLFANRNLITEFLHYIDVGAGIIDLRNTAITQVPILVSPDHVLSTGTFQGANGLVNWQVDTTFANGASFATNTITFSSLTPLGQIDFINYFDQGNQITPANINNEFLLQLGTPGFQPPTIPGQPAPLPVLPGADFRLATINNTERIGFAHGGVYTRGTTGLSNADYLGFAADINPNLQGQIAGTAGGQQAANYSIPGSINTANLPAIIDPALGPVNGLGEVTSAMMWRVDATATSATITTFLELVAQNPSSVGSPGDWRGVRLDQFSNDRNVAQVVDTEPAYIAAVGDNNSTPLTAQTLGKLAPNLKSGDDNRRLGFEIDGTIAFDNPADVDVYSFRADSGTEIWIDIDRTSYALDAMIELVTSDGTVLASATDSDIRAPLVNLNDPGLTSSPSVQALSFNKDPYNGRDTYSTNQSTLIASDGVHLSRDPILRVVLPNAANGTPLQDVPFFIRVRSQPTTFVGESGNIVNPGLTSGAYQLQVRLQQKDDKAGSTVKYSDIRYATRGIEVLGLPYHSPLTGETVEADNSPNSPNDTFAAAQSLGNLLRADRGTISVGGNVSSSTDVDWYRFDLGFDLLQVINNYSGGLKTWSTIFDMDYGNGLSRANATLAVFDDQGSLIFIGRDSDVQDDQGQTTSNLADGSFGKLDPYIGPVQMPAGSNAGQTRTYYVAVTNDRQMPQVLEQQFNAQATDTNIRLEPIDAIFRTATDHFNAVAPSGVYTGLETADQPENAYIDPNSNSPKSTLINPSTLQSLQANIRPFTLADVPLFVVSGNGLVTVNAMTGAQDITNYAGNIASATNLPVEDIAFRSDGELYAYHTQRTPGTTNTVGALSVVDWSTGVAGAVSNDNIPDLAANNPQSIGFSQATALAWGGSVIGGINNTELFYAVTDFNALIDVGPDGTPDGPAATDPTQDDIRGTTSRLYQANPNNGSAAVVQGSPGRRIGGAFDFINVTVPASASTNFGIPGISATFSSAKTGTLGNNDTVTINQPVQGSPIQITATGPGVTPGNVTITPSLDPVSATATSDFNSGFGNTPPTGGAINFTLVQPGSSGNGITINFQKGDETARQLHPPGPLGPTEYAISVSPDGRTITFVMDTDESDFNGDGVNPTTIDDVIGAINTQLGLSITASAATGSTTTFPIGRAILPPVAPVVFAGGSDNGTTLQSLVNAINADPAASQIIMASFAGPPDTSIAALPAGPFPINLTLTGGDNTVGVTNGLSFGSGTHPSDIPTGSTTPPGSGADVLYGITSTGKFLIDIGGTTVPVVVPPPGTPPTFTSPSAPLKAVSITIPNPNPALPPIIPNFTALTRGPQNLENGRFANMFFAVTDTGLLVALDANGNLQTVFDTNNDGTEDSSFRQLTGISATTGLAFSPFDFNLWHPTFQRSGDAGHEINIAPDNMHRSGDYFTDPTNPNAANHGRGRTNERNMSFRFGFEQWAQITGQLGDNYQTYNTVTTAGFATADIGSTGNANLLANAGQVGVIDATMQRELSLNPDFNDNYNTPGGAIGSLATDKFSLATIKATDKPTFYFDYFLETEDTNFSRPSGQLQRDSARVYVGFPLENGTTEWELLASNNSAFDSPGTGGIEGEISTFLSTSVTAHPDNPRQQVQLLHDNTNAWRQARVDLSRYAGKTNLQLRFDFSTAGAMPGLDHTYDDEFEDGFGNRNHRERSQNNDFEGFYVDNFTIGLAERGEMVTNAPVDTTFISTPTPQNLNPNTPFPTEVLTGPYQLEIRRAAEYAISGGGNFSDFVPFTSFDSNERLIADKRLAAPIPVEGFETQDFSTLPWSFTDDKDWTIADLTAVAGINGTSFGAVSGTIGNGQSSGLSVSLVTGNGNLTFDVAVSSRAGDFLRLYIDGFLANDPVNGTNGKAVYTGNDGDLAFTTVSIPVASGRHSFRWTYDKNSNDTGGSADHAYLDNISFPTPQIGVQDVYDDTLEHSPNDPFARRLPIGPTVAFPTSNEQIHFVDLMPNGLRRTGDENQLRPQGHIQIEQNMVYAASEIGILVDAAARDAFGNPFPGSLRNLPTLSTDRLVPGVTVANNIVANYGQTGIQFSGDPNLDDPISGLNVPLAAVPFGRAVNNSVYGGATATGTGILVNENAGPTLLNNIIANAITGVSVDFSSRNTTVLGVNVFANNTANTNGGTTTGTNAIFLTASDPLFVDPDNRNFYLAPNSRAIDSALDVLADRPSIAAVKSAIGIPQSPILAPTLDAFGQVRGGEPAPDADPTQPPTPGGGENVFVDRGAVERADFDVPSAQIVDPLDNDPAGRDRDDNANDVKIKNELLQRFVVQYSDDGVGIDDVTARDTRNYFVLQDGVLLTDGVEYSFDYNDTTDEAIFTPSSGTWPLNHTYSIQIRNTLSIDLATGDELGVRDLAGNYLGVNRATGPTAGQTLFTIFTGILRDFGDAPDSGPGTGLNNYETLAASNGPAHEVIAGFQLGATITEESEGQQSPNADGDKNANDPSTPSDDTSSDDGITFLTPLAVGVQSTIRVSAGIPSGMRGYLNGWIDLNRNGNFEDPGERVVTNREILAGSNDISFTFGNSSTPKGSTFARFRLTSADPVTNPVSSVGLEADGEVEDYKVLVSGPPFQNATRREDVNNDGRVTVIDAVLVINFINGFTLLVPPNSPIPLPPREPEFQAPVPTLDPTGGGLPGKGRYIDVNGDGRLSILDLVLVTNVLNNPQPPSQANGEGEGESAPEFSSAATTASSLAIPAVLLAAPDVVIETREVSPRQSTSATVTASAQPELADFSFLADDLYGFADTLGLIDDERAEATVSTTLDESNWDSLLSDLASDAGRNRPRGLQSR